MSRFLLRLMPILILPLLALALVARTIGSTQPPNPALAGFTTGCEGKPQPCWYGIVPGITTVEEGTTLLKNQGYNFKGESLTCDQNSITYCYLFQSEICHLQFNVYIRTEIILDLKIINCKHLVVAEVFNTLGTPSTIAFSVDPCGMSTYDSTFITLSTPGLVKPFTVVDKIHFRIALGEANCRYSMTPIVIACWHGFAPEWRYRQLDVGFLGCDEENGE